MAEFRKKPVVVNAFQWTGKNPFQLGDWHASFGKIAERFAVDEDEKLLIPTLEGTMTASPGDYIIRGVNGEFYPCKPDIFEKTYDDVSSEVGDDFDLSKFQPLDAAVFPSTDQTISVLPDAIYGGAHIYAIRNSLGFNAATRQAETGKGVQVLTFVYKPDGDAPMVEGLQSEQLALVLLDRCRKLNARFPSPFNEKQIAGLEMFLAGCRERVESRLAAGTMGQLKK